MVWRVGERTLGIGFRRCRFATLVPWRNGWRGLPMRHFAWFLVLALGFAMVTAGLSLWHDRGFSFSGLLPFSAEGLHPLYMLVVGMSVIPGALFEIFVLEQRRDGDG